MDEIRRDAGDGIREVFLNLLSFVTLYLTAIGTIVLAWGLADALFTDPLEQYRSVSGIRVAVAIVVVAYPVLIWINVTMYRRAKGGSPSPAPRLKKVLSYLTLFVISMTAIVDLITVLYRFMSGDLTARFAVKAFSIFVIVGLVWWYYFGEIKAERAAKRAVT